MKPEITLDETIRSILTEFKRVAVVGVSENPTRASYHIAKYLIDQGYTVIPINPALPEVLGLRCYPDLLSAPGPIEIVDIFRRVEFIPEIVDQAIEIGAKAVWMQAGLIDEVSAERARSGGLKVVMDHCIMVEHASRFQH
jgi:uncharacterized protein